VQQQYVIVQAINANTITISPGLYMTNWTAASSTKAFWWNKSSMIQNSGVEDLYIEGGANASGHNVYFTLAFACWAKNVYSHNAGASHIRTWLAKNIEVRHCTISGWQVYDAAHYGVEPAFASDTRVEDNIFYTFANAIAVWSSCGGVFAYNYLTNDAFASPPEFLSYDMMTHGGFPHFNLFEGNMAPNVVVDCIHGAQAFNTVFRNRLTGYEVGKTGGTYAMRIFNRVWNLSVIGNVLGTMGYHDAYQGITQGGDIYDFNYYGFDASTNPAVINSLIRHGNYDTVTKGIVWSSNPDHNIPNSLVYSSKPKYFGDRPWPPVDPLNPAAVDATRIPAGYRFAFGVDPPLAPGAPAMSINSGNRDYGVVRVGSTKDLTFTVQNLGGGTLAGTAAVAAPLSIVGPSAYSVGSNASQAITVRFTPTQAGPFSGVVTFAGGGGASITVTASAITP